MPIIKSISDLKNKTAEISHLAHESREPIFITKNGEGDLVVLSIAEYEQREKRAALYSKLAVAEAQFAAGAKGRPLKKVMKGIQKRLRELV